MPTPPPDRRDLAAVDGGGPAEFVPEGSLNPRMSFGEAMLRVAAGQKVRRRDWPDPADHLLLQGGIVHVHNMSGIHQLTVSDGDILGNDWVVCEDA